MKKYLFLGLAALGLMTACTKDETIVVNPSNQIAFGNAFVDKATRATDITADNIGSYSVYAYVDNVNSPILTNEEVAQDGSYANTQYWVDKKTYYFNGIAPYGGKWTFAVGATPDKGTITLDNKTSTGAAGEQDLVFGKTSLTCDIDAVSKVSLDFGHLLSRVKFTITNGMSNKNTTLNITDIAIDNVTPTGVYDISAGTWDVSSATTESLSFGAISDITTTTPLASAHKYLLPSKDAAAFTVTFTVQMMNGTVKVAEYTHSKVALTGFDLEQGYSYNITATINDSNINPDPTNPDTPALKPIEFDVQTVAAWQDWSTKANTVSNPKP